MMLGAGKTETTVDEKVSGDSKMVVMTGTDERIERKEESGLNNSTVEQE